MACATEHKWQKNRVYLLRLQTLIIDVGTLVVRNIFDNRNHNVPLNVILNNEKRIIKRLMEEKAITQSQFELLYPRDGGSPTTDDLNLRLIIILLLNLNCCRIGNWFNSHKPPEPRNTSLRADIFRLKTFRNEISHISTTYKIQRGTFEKKWNEIEQVLIRLNLSVSNPVPNLPQLIEDCKNSPLDPEIKREELQRQTIVKGSEILIQIEKKGSSVTTEIGSVTEEVGKVRKDVDIIKEETEVVTNHLTKYIDSVKEVVDAVKNMNKEVATVKTAVEERIAEVQIEGYLPKEILNMDRDSIDLYKKALHDGKVSVHNIRVMVVGHYDVGKTTLTKRLLGEPVDIKERASTDGIDVHVDRCKISLKDGTWILQKSDKARRAIFHQLVELFNKDGKQADTQPEMNATSDLGNVSSLDLDKVNEQTTSAEQPVAELKDRAEVEIYSRIETVSSLDLDKANEQTTSAEQPVAELKDRAEIEIYSRIETASVSGVSDRQSASKTDESVDEKYAQNLRHLKKFVENVQVDKEHLGTSDLSLWDFAGQNVFYATHQVFFSRRAVYLLVTNISKHIDDTVDDDPWHTDCRGEAKCQIAKYIDFWLNSIHEFCSYPGESGPPVVLVGTFADQVKKDISPDDACSSLRGFLVDKAASCHLTTENFLIDNSIEDENIQSLKKHIFDEASKQTYWGEDIPAKWVTLEDILIGIKEENLKVLHKDRLKELNMTLPAPIETDEELELYLKFHHEMGNIIYFSKEDLTDYILLDPQWLIDAFKSVITAKSFCISRTNIQKEWMEFERTAMLKPGLIDAVWGKCENSVYNKYRDLLLTYMEILRLVARPVKQEDYSAKVEDWYFVPCMLKEPPPEKVTSCCDSPHCKSTSKLCYTTAEEPERRFLPATMFNKLLAACLQKWPLSKQNRKSMIFCGGAIFSLEENHFLYIFFYEHVIQVWITRLSLDGQFPDISLCTETKNNIEYILKTNIRMHSKFIAFVKCPRAVLYSNENMVQLEPTEDFPTDEIVCYCQENEHVVRYSDLTKYWSFVQDSNHSSEFESEQTSLTEKDFSKIASRIGEEYLQLGRKLGLTEAKLDHIRLDKWTTQDRIVAMLCEWKKQMADKATACYLRQALAAIGKDASAVLR